MRLVIDLQGSQGTSRWRGIGRYSRALALAMARNRGPHDVWIALSEVYAAEAEELRDAFAGVLPPDRVVTWKAPAGTSEEPPANDARRAAAERLRAAFLASLRPDLVHVSSLFEGFGEDVVTGVPDDTDLPPTAYTLYDLIPFLRPDTYLPSDRVRGWYFRRLLLLRRAAGLLAISESSRREATDRLAYPPDRVHNMLAGVAPAFRPAGMPPEAKRALLARYGLPDDFILCVGAVERRKNVDGLIRAYALLPPALRARHKLVATGWNNSGDLDSLRGLAERLGLAPGDVLLLRQFVLEEDLPGLYEACAVFVLPSLHEGFGLPAAEAMACGAPVLGSRATSIPEVIGRDDALFDPESPADMAARMADVLTRPGFAADLRRHGLERAKLFTWEGTAERAWRGLEAIHAASSGEAAPDGARPAAVPVRKPRLTVVTPPLAGALAGDTTPRGALLAGLTRHYAVALVHPGAEGGNRVHGPATAAAAGDRTLYLPAGAPECSAATLDGLDANPGVVALGGDRPLEALLGAGAAGEAACRRALLDAHGWPALVAARRDGLGAAAKRFSGVAHVMGRAVGMLAASEEEAATLRGEATAANGAAAAVRTVPAPGWRAADAWRDAIEALYDESPAAAMDRCLIAAAAEAAPAADEDTLADVAASLAATFNVEHGRRLLLDATEIAAADAGSGIQRVVREIVRHLAPRGDLGARVEAVRSVGGALLSARGFVSGALGLPDAPREDVPLSIGRSDVFVGLDVRLHEAADAMAAMRRVRMRGGKAVAVVYDLLPVRFPSYFPRQVGKLFPAWLSGMARTADGVVCISRAVADELCAWLEANPPDRRTPLGVGFFHLGSDFDGAAPPGGAAAAGAADGVLDAAAARPTLLMVGTIEPRKGHAHALAALETLWARGVDAGLVVAGRQGWLMEGLASRIRAHPEFGRRLHWVEAPSDTLLRALYASAGALLMASEGEGFGLPIVEAARAGVAVVARDLPVFREVAGEHAVYFGGPAADPLPLAEAVAEWIGLRERGREPDSRLIRTLTWEQSAAEFADRVLNGGWYRVWSPPGDGREG